MTKLWYLPTQCSIHEPNLIAMNQHMANLEHIHLPINPSHREHPSTLSYSSTHRHCNRQKTIYVPPQPCHLVRLADEMAFVFHGRWRQCELGFGWIHLSTEGEREGGAASSSIYLSSSLEDSNVCFSYGFLKGKSERQGVKSGSVEGSAKVRSLCINCER